LWHTPYDFDMDLDYFDMVLDLKKAQSDHFRALHKMLFVL